MTDYFVEKHLIKQTHKDYKELDNLCFLSKNLYNATLYEVRKYFKETGKYLNYNSVNKLFTTQNQADYRALPAKVAKHTQQLVEANYKSFFESLKADLKARPPKYLDKNGRQVVHYEKGALSFKAKENYIKLSKTNIFVKSNIAKENVEFVRIVHLGNHINIEVGYKPKKEKKKNIKKKKLKIASFDPGLNNLFTLISNVDKPIIFNGKPMKSINQYYNKKRAKIQSELQTVNNKDWSKKLDALTMKRNNKIDDYIHKLTTLIIDYLVSNQVDLLIIGQSIGWKQDINLGKKNNQNFVNAPIAKAISKIKYKAEQKGMTVIVTEESYTSKASFLDNDFIPTYDPKNKGDYKFSGKRIKRGLYKTATGTTINADVNGALNILKKYAIENGIWTEKLKNDLIKYCLIKHISVITPPYKNKRSLE